MFSSSIGHDVHVNGTFTTATRLLFGGCVISVSSQRHSVSSSLPEICNWALMRSPQDSRRQFAMLLLTQFQDRHRIVGPQLPPRDLLTQLCMQCSPCPDRQKLGEQQ